MDNLNDNIAKIINKYNFYDIPENLRKVCKDNFCEPRDSDTDPSEGDTEDLEQPLAKEPDNILEVNIQDIPVVLEVGIFNFNYFV